MKVKYGPLIILFLFLLILLNVIGYQIYFDAYPDRSPALKLWQYLDSSTFKVISGTFVLPIIGILIEKKFKIIEVARERRINETEAIRQNQINKRHEVHNAIISDWNTLYGYINELRFYVPKDIEKQNGREQRLNSIQRNIINNIVNWDKNINNLYHHYPALRDLEAVFLYYLNVFITTSTSVAFHVRENLDDAKLIDDLQHALEVITGTLKSIWFSNFFAVIKQMNEKLEAKDLDGQQIAAIDADIKQRGTDLKLWAQYLVKEEERVSEFPTGIIMPKDLIDHIDEFKKFLVENPKKSMYEFALLQDFRTSYDQIDQSAMMRALNLYYSKDAILGLAKSMGFDGFLLRVWSQANQKGLKDIKI